ncbi:hypothetical protein CON84_01765 [Bacillus sp. AFS094228]|nr:hypothetical protein CON84_01765 [Bacillus sp. AFS094228]
MDRRNFLMESIFWVVSFILGYTSRSLKVDSTAVIDSDKSLHETNEISKKNSEFIDVVEDFNADPTGVKDSTIAIQNALNSAKSLVINNSFTKLAQVIFPAGRYKIKSQIIGSQFVKIKAVGLVIFETSVYNDAAFWFSPLKDDPTYTTLIKKQQWFRAPFINGVDGGFIFVNKLNKKTSNSTAIEFGSRTDLSGKPFARYSACDIAVENYNIGFKFNHFNNYISSFERVHLEGNNINVSFGVDDQNVVNSGENIHFSDSIFAGADSAFEWLSDGFDLRLVNCSTDFLQRVFYMKRGWRNISFFGGHIEAIGTRYQDNIMKGGIAVYDVTNTKDEIVHLSIIGTSALLRRFSMFRCSISSKLRISLDNFQYRSTDLETNANVAWLADDEVIVDKKNIFFQGEGILPSRQVNEIANSTFKNDKNTSGSDMILTPPVGYSLSRKYSVSNKVVSTVGYDNGKAVEFISNNNSAYVKLTTTEFMNVKAGQTVLASCALMSNDVTKANIKVRIIFYDSGDRLLYSSKLEIINKGFKNGIWNYPIRPRIEVAPPGSAKYKVEFVLGNCNGVIGYMSGLFSTVCE